jgi:hypothetical protein
MMAICHGRMARGGHGLPKVSLGPAMPHPSTPCERATPETPRRTPMRFADPSTVRSNGIFSGQNLLTKIVIHNHLTVCKHLVGG